MRRSGYRGRSPPPYRRYYADEQNDTASVPVNTKTEDEHIEDLMSFFHRESERKARARGDLDRARFHADLAAGMSGREALARHRAARAAKRPRRVFYPLGPRRARDV